MSVGGESIAVFERARQADIAAVAGTKLFKAGRRLRGECPICGASKGKKNGGAFSCDPAERVFYCFACLAKGDVIDLERLRGGGSRRDAAERLAGFVPTAVREASPAARPSPPQNDGPTSSERVAQELWREATATIGGTLVETYLRRRMIDPELIQAIDAGRRLRFHPAAKWGWDPERRTWIRAPAMLARVGTQGGPTGGVHATYLAADGRGKARLDPPKRMWGRQVSVDGQPGGTILIWGKGPLIVGEGIESSLSAAQLQGHPCRVAAALSLGRLQGGWKADAWGRIDPTMMEADPETPAFTLPNAGEVVIAIDRDMSPIEVKVRRVGGGTVKHRLTSDERARICAGLAIQAWKRAGAESVRAIGPAAGRDFNTELVERAS